MLKNDKKNTVYAIWWTKCCLPVYFHSHCETEFNVTSTTDWTMSQIVVGRLSTMYRVSTGLWLTRRRTLPDWEPSCRREMLFSTISVLHTTNSRNKWLTSRDSKLTISDFGDLDDYVIIYGIVMGVSGICLLPGWMTRADADRLLTLRWRSCKTS